MEEIKERLITYTPKATPYAFRVPVTPEELRLKLDEIWERDKDKLSKLYKGKKKKGGKVSDQKARAAIEKSVGFGRIYNQDLAMWGQKLIEEEFGQPIILINTIDVQEGPEECFLDMDLYIYPEAHLTEDKKEAVKNFKMPKMNLPSEEESLNKRIEELQLTHLVRTPVEAVEEGSEVVFDVYTAIGGKRYENGIVKLRRAELKDITPEAVKEAVKGCKKGDRVSVQFESTFEDESKGQIIDAEVTVQEVYSLSKLDPEDVELYIKAGFEDRKTFEENFKEQYAGYVKGAEDNTVYQTIIEHIIGTAGLDPIPERFIDVSINNFLGQSKSKNTDPEVSKYVYQQVLNQVVTRMAAYAYIDLFELDRSIEHEDLVKFMKEHVTFE